MCKMAKNVAHQSIKTSKDSYLDLELSIFVKIFEL